MTTFGSISSLLCVCLLVTRCRPWLEEVGLPLAPEKFVWPTQKLEFLGLTIDTIRMAVAIPRDKREVILKEIDKMLGVTKCKVKQVQSLAGHLNFVTRAVPHGRPFSRKLYSMVAGMKLHWHVSVTKEVKRDLLMWKKFIQEYGGMDNNSNPRHPSGPCVHRCSNNTAPRMGCMVGHGMDVGPVGCQIHAATAALY